MYSISQKLILKFWQKFYCTIK